MKKPNPFAKKDAPGKSAKGGKPVFPPKPATGGKPGMPFKKGGMVKGKC